MIADRDREIIKKTAVKYHAKRVMLFGSSLVPDRESRDIDIGVEDIDDKDLYLLRRASVHPVKTG